MVSLDRSRPFGTISPQYFDPQTMDRAALTEQDGRLFDAYDDEIIPGVPGPRRESEEGQEPEAMSVGDLIAQADVIPFAELKRRAKEVLGAACPASKALIVTALSKAKAEYEQRQAKRGKPVEQSVATKPDKGGLDLAAWGRGQRNYLFGEVRKAIRERFNCAVSTSHDAVDVLISNGLVEAAQARKD